MEESLRFFQNYKGLLFSGEKPLDSLMPDMEIGPVEPWVSDVPYNVYDSEWPAILAQSRWDLFPANPLEPGHGPGTYRMWDWILSSGISRIRSSPTLEAHCSARNIKPVRDFTVNTLWMDDVKNAFAHGSYIGLEKYVVDLLALPEGKRLLEAAHVLAHFRSNHKLSDTSNRIMLHGRMTEDLIKAVSELALSWMWDIPIDIEGVGDDVPMAYGVVVRPSTSLSFETEGPALRLPVRKKMHDTVNKALVYVCAVAQIGHDPKRVVNPAADTNVMLDWWSYQPIRIFLVGWETAAWMAMQELAWPDPAFYRSDKRKCDFAANVRDLMPMTSLEHYLSLAARMQPKLPQRYILARDWLESDMYQYALRHTPPLPCDYCMCTRNDYAGGLQPPQGPRPVRQKYVTDEWTMYFRSFRQACKHVIKAKKTLYAPMGRYRQDMSERKRNFKNRVQELRRKHRARRKKW